MLTGGAEGGYTTSDGYYVCWKGLSWLEVGVGGVKGGKGHPSGQGTLMWVMGGGVLGCLQKGQSLRIVIWKGTITCPALPYQQSRMQ